MEKINKELNLIDILGIPALAKFSINSKNSQAYKTYISQQMLKSFLASNSVYLSFPQSHYFQR